ncbi:hypothetical protein A2U01_0106558, partial [Trifolium medium]|nr:hypothetical protein [Trifolium medium]
MTTVSLSFASPPQYSSGTRVITAEWNSRFVEAFHKLLSAPLLTLLAPPPPNTPNRFSALTS